MRTERSSLSRCGWKEAPFLVEVERSTCLDKDGKKQLSRSGWTEAACIVEDKIKAACLDEGGKKPPV